MNLFDAQLTFRKVLDAMARPGKVVKMPDIALNPSTENKYPFAILFTLLDHEVSFKVLDPKNRENTEEISRYISSNTGSRESQLENAVFFLIYGGSSNGLIKKMKRGTLEYPDASATLIYDVGRIGKGIRLTISGPGIRAEREIEIDGIEEEEIREIVTVNSEFPLGIDAIFSDRYGNIVCLPRSTRVRA
jgi:alpha-D-ribose 1-methylphosphonate 5-triphosphate synthase subunit PhnH